ncbi:hypothetical protein MAPG_11615 [Magnaporthiopsis poae ATCC 64411]|uniref:Uncharacterized protein n=1 Tax=Magnaporthiopsis poae (strain ATCC 64411 / 73-15) TaxID=644358 RepID=A0A0C4EFQ9_MAGP6|nr:hypothetical protein MAPG_11615 [Magnaporthiopsis poae ATCC 64411]
MEASAIQINDTLGENASVPESLPSHFPFTYLARFRLLVCTCCRHAVWASPDNLRYHLKSSPKCAWMSGRPGSNLALCTTNKEKIIRQCALAFPEALRAEPDHNAGPGTFAASFPFPLPDRSAPAIPELRAAEPNFYGCDFTPLPDAPACTYACQSQDGIKAHLRKAHAWVNPRPAGTLAPAVGLPNPPFRYPVHAQQFFTTGRCSSYFEVGGCVVADDGQPPPSPATAAAVTATADAPDALPVHLQTRIRKHARGVKESIERGAHVLRADEDLRLYASWHDKIRWSYHFDGCNLRAIAEFAVQPAENEAATRLGLSAAQDAGVRNARGGTYGQ